MWEYQIIDWDENLGKDEGFGDTVGLERCLNAAGAGGWELVTVEHVGAGPNISSFIMKRRVESGDR